MGGDPLRFPPGPMGLLYWVGDSPFEVPPRAYGGVKHEVELDGRGEGVSQQRRRDGIFHKQVLKFRL